MSLNTTYGVGKCEAINSGWRKEPARCSYTGFTYIIEGEITQCTAILCDYHKIKLMGQHKTITRK